MNKGNRIFLIGFMGSGKTTIGRKLANKLHQPFFDLDEEISKKEGLSINDLFQQHGEASFRKMEQQALEQLIQKHSHFVLSLGGGTPCYFDNLTLIKQAGVSIYLKYNAGILSARLSSSNADRPLLKDFNEEALKEFVRTKLTEREAHYHQADVVVEKNNLKVEDLIELLQEFE